MISEKRKKFIEDIYLRLKDIDYWCILTDYNRFGLCGTIKDIEENETYSITIRSLERAINKILFEEECQVEYEIVEQVALANKYNSTDHLDTYGIDAIVQIATFDEIKY
jgi:hypothetical protein